MSNLLLAMLDKLGARHRHVRRQHRHGHDLRIDDYSYASRRRAVRRAAAAPVPGRSPPLRCELPLDNLGLEHLDIVVPDTAAAAQFYARIFRTELHQQPVRDSLRYLVVLGDRPGGSRRLGTSPSAQPRAGRRRSGITACSPRTYFASRMAQQSGGRRPAGTHGAGGHRHVAGSGWSRAPAVSTAGGARDRGAVESPRPSRAKGWSRRAASISVMLRVSSSTRRSRTTRTLYGRLRASARRERSRLVRPRARDPYRAAAGDGWQPPTIGHYRDQGRAVRSAAR